MSVKAVSYGGGVQSNGLLVLAAKGIIDFKTFLFCNVGDDSENPETLAYVDKYAKPYAKKHGLEIVTLQKTRLRGEQAGEPVTLYQTITRPGSRSIPIPVRMNGNGAPGNRSCTVEFKIHVVDRWLRKQGAHRNNEGAEVALGISLDEFQRAKQNIDTDTLAWKTNVFPLLDSLPRPYTRQDCINEILSAGLPVPPKSSCWFCPYHSLSVWQEMRTQNPAQFWQAVELERFINKRREKLGLDRVWFTSKLKPLDDVTTDHKQLNLFDDDEDFCESGYCLI
jgi:3'-phosphoadenosine 5'-phosphosulfate sulfotransferase (PAPS reductase)/FAD synthetase